MPRDTSQLAAVAVDLATRPVARLPDAVLGPKALSDGIPRLLDRLHAGERYFDPLLGVCLGLREQLRPKQVVFGLGLGTYLGAAPFARIQRVDDEAPATALPALLGRWPELTGKGRRIVAIDSGVDAAHPCFQHKPIAFASMLQPGSVPREVPGGKHGTQCAGLIGSPVCLRDGRIGVAPECVLGVGQLGLGDAAQATAIDFLLLLSWAVHYVGARVVSFSNGARREQLREYGDPEIFGIVARNLRARDAALLFCATGNGGSGEMDWPAGAEGIIAVGGFAWRDRAEPGSCHIDTDSDGHANAPLVGKHILGPSAGIPSLSPGHPGEHRIRDFRGSSAACAFVAGVALLYFEAWRKRHGSEAGVEDVVSQMFRDARWVPHPDQSRSVRHALPAIQFPGQWR